MEHDLELIIARLELLEIEVCNILYKPRDLGNLSFSTSSYPGTIGNLIFPCFPYPGKIGSMIFVDFCFVLQKRRAPKFHAEWSNCHAEISHMRPIQGQKLKLFQTPISS